MSSAATRTNNNTNNGNGSGTQTDPPYEHPNLPRPIVANYRRGSKNLLDMAVALRHKVAKRGASPRDPSDDISQEAYLILCIMGHFIDHGYPNNFQQRVIEHLFLEIWDILKAGVVVSQFASVSRTLGSGKRKRDD